MTRELGRLELWLFDRKCRRRYIHARGWSCLDWHMRTCWRCNLRRCRKSAPRERWERARQLKAATDMPCRDRNVNVCVAEGCYGEACIRGRA